MKAEPVTGQLIPDLLWGILTGVNGENREGEKSSKHWYLCFLCLLLLNYFGCAWYSRQAVAPDSFNYTLAVDHQGMKPAQHYFGVSWNLKRGVTP